MKTVRYDESNWERRGNHPEIDLETISLSENIGIRVEDGDAGRIPSTSLNNVSTFYFAFFRITQMYCTFLIYVIDQPCCSYFVRGDFSRHDQMLFQGFHRRCDSTLSHLSNVS